jgi:hypothetical protein
MIKLVIGLTFLLVSTIGFSQPNQNKKSKVRFRKQINATAKEQIYQLKEGALFVKLKTRKNSILALRNIGKDNLADRIENEQKGENINIISAFRNNFNFCPIFFFYSDYSSNIVEKQFDQVIFLNDSLKADTTIKFNGMFFFIAEFSTIEQDTAKYFSYNSSEADANWSVKKVSNYYGGPDMGFSALIIKSDKFIQLRRPFPYYVSTYELTPFKRSFNRVVSKMNRILHNFHERKIK